MGILEHILSSRGRAEIFRLLFGLGDAELHGREIERRSGLAIGTIRHELKNLEQLDLVRGRRNGNRLYYRANKDHPLYREIHNLVLKTAGLAEVIRKALSNEGVQVAFVFGSVAQGKEKAASDVDLMVIGSLGLRELTRRLSGVSDTIGREINPYILSAEDFKTRRQEEEHFITRVLQTPRLFVIGSEDELTTLGR
ncbi:MAG: nucleotidyltransferase domain-containing protein [bacterium]|nr:nucleotidyltransferase domain-containing protein [bacterium]